MGSGSISEREECSSEFAQYAQNSTESSPAESPTAELLVSPWMLFSTIRYAATSEKRKSEILSSNYQIDKFQLILGSHSQDQTYIKSLIVFPGGSVLHLNFDWILDANLSTKLERPCIMRCFYAEEAHEFSSRLTFKNWLDLLLAMFHYQHVELIINEIDVNEEKYIEEFSNTIKDLEIATIRLNTSNESNLPKIAEHFLPVNTLFLDSDPFVDDLSFCNIFRAGQKYVNVIFSPCESGWLNISVRHISTLTSVQNIVLHGGSFLESDMRWFLHQWKDGANCDLQQFCIIFEMERKVNNEDISSAFKHSMTSTDKKKRIKVYAKNGKVATLSIKRVISSNENKRYQLIFIVH